MVKVVVVEHLVPRARAGASLLRPLARRGVGAEEAGEPTLGLAPRQLGHLSRYSTVQYSTVHI